MEERKASSSGTAEMRVGVEAEVVMLNRGKGLGAEGQNPHPTALVEAPTIG